MGDSLTLLGGVLYVAAPLLFGLAIHLGVAVFDGQFWDCIKEIRTSRRGLRPPPSSVNSDASPTRTSHT